MNATKTIHSHGQLFRKHADEQDLDITSATLSSPAPGSTIPADEGFTLVVSVTHENFADVTITTGEYAIRIKQTGEVIDRIAAPNLAPGEVQTDQRAYNLPAPEQISTIPDSGPVTVQVQAPADTGHTIDTGTFTVGSGGGDQTLLVIAALALAGALVISR